MTPLAFLHEMRALLNTPEPARLGPQRRLTALSLGELDERLQRLFSEHESPPAAENLIRSVIYLWHDHLDQSHRISQDIESRDGSLVHGIMHRREPDYGNAKYWFRRVGPHPSFIALSLRAGELFEHREESDLQSRLVPNKMWDPFAFVDAVEDVASGQFPSKVELLEQIQKLEFECLLENLLNRA